MVCRGAVLLPALVVLGEAAPPKARIVRLQIERTETAA